LTVEAITAAESAPVVNKVETSPALRWFLRIARFALAAVFLYAVFAKINYPPGNFLTFEWSNWKLALDIFAIAVNGYGVLPQWAIMPVAYGVPLLETVLALLLISGVGLRWSAAASSALLLFFFFLMLRAYLLGMSIECGCFGPGDTLSAKTLMRDGALLALALGITFAAFRQAQRPGTSHR
jgi:uncharacterized membrane protein YphA (DoxX/SURF4 family)